MSRATSFSQMEMEMNKNAIFSSEEKRWTDRLSNLKIMRN